MLPKIHFRAAAWPVFALVALLAASLLPVEPVYAQDYKLGALEIGLIFSLTANLVRRSAAIRTRCAQLAFLLTAIVLGPGLIIDVGLKDHWGRARPAQVQEFGGTRQFTPALQPTSECPDNCSFVSGHAAFGYQLIALAYLGDARRRRRWLIIALLAGSLLGLLRIAQGAHFLSDIAFSFFFTWLGSWAAYLIWRRALVK